MLVATCANVAARCVSLHCVVLWPMWPMACILSKAPGELRISTTGLREGMRLYPQAEVKGSIGKCTAEKELIEVIPPVCLWQGY